MLCFKFSAVRIKNEYVVCQANIFFKNLLVLRNIVFENSLDFNLAEKYSN